MLLVPGGSSNCCHPTFLRGGAVCLCPPGISMMAASSLLANRHREPLKSRPLHRGIRNVPSLCSGILPGGTLPRALQAAAAHAASSRSSSWIAGKTKRVGYQRDVAQTSDVAIFTNLRQLKETPPEIPSHRGATCAAAAATGAASPPRDHVCTPLRSSLPHRPIANPPVASSLVCGPWQCRIGARGHGGWCHDAGHNSGQECQSVVRSRPSPAATSSSSPRMPPCDSCFSEEATPAESEIRKGRFTPWSPRSRKIASRNPSATVRRGEAGQQR